MRAVPHSTVDAMDGLGLRSASDAAALHLATEPVPPLALEIAEILLRLHDDRTTVRDLEHCIEREPQLEDRLLALINSPFYGLQSISSARHAVMVLGFRGLRSMLLGLGVTDVLSGDFLVYGSEPLGLARRAIGVAAAARALAKELSFTAAARERLFVAGLLHEIGKVLLAPHLTPHLLPTEPMALILAERAALGVDHAEAGRLVAREWRIDPDVQALLRQRDQDAGRSSAAPLPAVLQLAQAIVHQRGLGYRPGSVPVMQVRPMDALPRLSGSRWHGALDGAVEAVDIADRSWFGQH